MVYSMKEVLLTAFACLCLGAIIASLLYYIDTAAGLGDPYPPVTVVENEKKESKIIYPDGYMAVCNNVKVYCIRDEGDMIEWERDEWYRKNTTHVIDLIPML